MGWKRVDVLSGDTLQRISARELGDASRWVDIALLNNLKPPYLGIGEGLAAPGSAILLPIEVVNPIADTNDQFLTDLSMPDGVLDIQNGDFTLISGVPNLIQALKMHVVADKRSLWFHPEYGCWIRTILGEVNRETAGSLAGFYVKSALLEDPRVSDVNQVNVEMQGDVIRVYCDVLPVYGEAIAYTQEL
jgi:LysM repeat protein